jgi:hypothetical protein
LILVRQYRAIPNIDEFVASATKETQFFTVGLELHSIAITPRRVRFDEIYLHTRFRLQFIESFFYALSLSLALRLVTHKSPWASAALSGRKSMVITGRLLTGGTCFYYLGSDTETDATSSSGRLDQGPLPEPGTLHKKDFTVVALHHATAIARNIYYNPFEGRFSTRGPALWMSFICFH